MVETKRLQEFEQKEEYNDENLENDVAAGSSSRSMQVLIQQTIKKFQGSQQSTREWMTFLKAILAYKEVPNDLTDSQYKDLSFILQKGIMQRLRKLSNSSDRLEVHELICQVFVKLFARPQKIIKLKLEKRSVSDLMLSEFLNSGELS